VALSNDAPQPDLNIRIGASWASDGAAVWHIAANTGNIEGANAFSRLAETRFLTAMS
jgi:hypothetical protein